MIARLPALVQGPALALAILVVGQLPPGVFLILALRFTPVLPWFVLGSAIWLIVFWAWLDGRWRPSRTGDWRRALLRAASLPPRIWTWSLVAGGCGMACVLTGALLTGLVAELPSAAREAPFDLSPYPWWTITACFLQLALVAGVVEEAAFRGYMLSLVERRHGWLVGILSVAALFYIVHRGHAYATLAFVPFFVAYSLLHGLLVYCTRSILPSVVLHVLGDLTILPMQYGVIHDPLGTSVRMHVLVLAGTGVAAAILLRRLAGLTRDRRREATNESEPANA